MEIDLRAFTPARVGIGRTGHSLPTAELLRFELDRARARDAVYQQIDSGWPARPHVSLKSAAHDRETYLRRPDLGRRLNEESQARLTRGDYDAAIVIADGLSALAVHRHSLAVVDELTPLLAGWRMAPLAVVSQGRVAIGDEIGQRLGARMVAILVGERPGLSSPDSLGIYLTWDPRPARTDAERNCISNVRAGGLGYRSAAHSLCALMNAARERRLTGVSLKEGFAELES